MDHPVNGVLFRVPELHGPAPSLAHSKILQGDTQNMTTRATLAGWRAVACSAALLVLVGCGDDGNTIVDPPDSPALAETLGAPAGVSHFGAIAGDAVRWAAPSTDRVVAGYNIYIYDPNPTTGEAFTRVNSSPLTVRSFVFPALTPGETCYVRVRAIDESGNEGDWSPSLEFVARGPAGDRPGHLGQTEGTEHEGEADQL